MATSFPMVNPWSDLEGLNAAKLYARITQVINDAAAQASAASAALGQGLLGEATSSAGTTLAATGGVYVPASASVTFTLATQRRVRIAVTSDFQVASAAARFLLRPAYNVGASAGTATAIGLAVSAYVAVAGTGGVNGVSTEASVLLAAGTYTAYAGLFKVSGGAATDAGVSNRVSVYDVGAS